MPFGSIDAKDHLYSRRPRVATGFANSCLTQTPLSTITTFWSATGDSTAPKVHSSMQGYFRDATGARIATTQSLLRHFVGRYLLQSFRLDGAQLRQRDP